FTRTAMGFASRVSSRGDHADDNVDDTFLDDAFLDDHASDNLDNHEGTLVGSDFTDKWFQTQAEDLGEVEVWLAQQVDPQSPQPGSPTPSPSASSSTSFTRKRRLSDEGAQQGSQDESSVGAGDGGGGRGGGGGPGRPAHGCGCNGQGVRAHKRRKAAHSSLREEEEDDVSDNVSDNGVSDNVVSDNGASDHGATADHGASPDHGVSEGGEPEGNQENTEETTSSRWTVSSIPSAASQEVRHSAMTLLLEIGLGEGTSLEFSESTAWIADLLEAVKGISWADPVSLEANNLFAAKINSILHHKRLCQKESGQVQKASLRPVLGKLIRDEKLKLSSLLRWYSAGSRWGRLASGGTVYLLMVIARKPSIASKLKGRRVTSTTIVELSNMLRYPQIPEIQDILRDCLVPLLIKVAAKGKKKYPFTKNNRQTWTEEMRQKAEEGTVVKTLDELAQGMRNRFYDDKEVS
ncbi:hypothetical protein F5878DRAFT_647900, partial [Lentinula raphanica]